MYRPQKQALMSAGKTVLVFLICLALSISVNAQSSSLQQPLKVSWQVMQNDFNGSNTLSELHITNTSGEALPASGWTIYFSHPGKTHTTTPGLSVSFVNGDLFKLFPTAGFVPVPAGGSLKVLMERSGAVNSISQMPGGFYIVWDKAPLTALPLKFDLLEPSEQYLKKVVKTNAWMDPAVVFAKNNSVRELPSVELPLIFPTPNKAVLSNGTFSITSATRIVAESGLEKEAAYLSKELTKIMNNAPKVQPLSLKDPAIVLQKNMQLKPEAYTLEVGPKGIVIAASSGAGAFYGIQSLKTMLAPESWRTRSSKLDLRYIKAEDEPRFGKRSFMLDVSRNFQSKEEIFRILDVMSLYKLNVFHFHFSEDEGWRVEIPSLPELTSVGSYRGHTLTNLDRLQPSFNSGGVAEGSTGSGHYTKADFIEILKYASERHIAVIPEIETPGHARAAIRSMERRFHRLMKEGKEKEAWKYRLVHPGDTSRYRSVQGWNDNIIDVALPSVYSFLDVVTNDLIAMYKEAGASLKTIHFGGDEVPPGVWEHSPAYLELRKKRPEIKNTDDLWYYYFSRVDSMMKKKGLYVSGWEEAGMRRTMLDGKPHYIPNPDFADDNFHLDVWHTAIGSGSEDLAYRLANAGYKVNLSSVSNLYFDLAYNNSYHEPGLRWGGLVDIDKPYYFVPFDMLKNVKEDGQGRPLKDKDFSRKMRLTDYGKENIVGVQGLLWAEYLFSPERLEYMMLPKLLSLAERAWAAEPDWAKGDYDTSKDQAYQNVWNTYVNVLGKRELPRLNHYNGGYTYRIPEPGLQREGRTVRANMQVPGFEVRYTTDGTEPTRSSKLYQGPLTNSGAVKFAAFDARGNRSRVVTID